MLRGVLLDALAVSDARLARAVVGSSSEQFDGMYMISDPFATYRLPPKRFELSAHTLGPLMPR